MYKYLHYGWNRRYAFPCYSPTAEGSRGSRAAPVDTPYESRSYGSGRRGGHFGARRPLRHLSYHLDLDESQQRQIGAVLERLKNDMEQARLDEKKTVTELAGLVTGDGVSVDDLQLALAPRVDSARNLQTAVAKALQEMVELLDRDQREEFSYLLQSGAFKL